MNRAEKYATLLVVTIILGTTGFFLAISQINNSPTIESDDYYLVCERVWGRYANGTEVDGFITGWFNSSYSFGDYMSDTFTNWHTVYGDD